MASNSSWSGAHSRGCEDHSEQGQSSGSPKGSGSGFRQSWHRGRERCQSENRRSDNSSWKPRNQKESTTGEGNESSQTQERWGIRPPSRGRGFGGGPDRLPFRRDQSGSRERSCGRPLSVAKNFRDFPCQGASDEHHEGRSRFRQDNYCGRRDSEDRRGNRHHLRGRSAAGFLDQPDSRRNAKSGQAYARGSNHSVTSWNNMKLKDYSRNNDKDDFRKLAGKRAGSHPSLLAISKGWDSDQRGQSNEKFQNQSRTPRVNNLDYRALKKIFEMEPSDVVMKLASPGSGLKEFLSHEDMTDELIAIALEVLGKACSSKSNRENLQHLLIDVKESRFLKRLLPMYVMRMSRHNDSVKREQSIMQVDQILALHQTLISVFPASTILDVSLIVALLQTEITYLQSTGLTIPKETENSITSLQRIITHLQEKKREGTLRSDNYTYITGNLEELDIEDFRYMSIFPTYEDIHLTAKPFMRPNIIGQRFEDTKTYLDTHFRLLREDFIRPLRDGISQVLKFDGKDLRKGRFDDIRIYLNAYILSPICTHKGILYRVQFGIDNLKSVNWESSKRLLYGALVCLSRDNFETMIFATVANRDVKDLQNGITTLDFTEESRLKLSEFQENDYFLMVETTAFFEAYRHVLGGLKEMALGELPMQKYIVSCDTNISAPQYLMNHRHTYSLQSLTTEGPVRIQELEKSVSTEESDSSDTSDTDDILARQDFKELLGLPWRERHDVLNFADWPSKQLLKLDDSQLQAVQMALTKELAIIQGPPGTGKTYIGLKIVKTILSNSNTWRSTGGCPILVVCYTNHALDQFLEGIHKFLRTGLVRVGGRCASEVLQKFSLNNLRRNNMFKQNLPGHLRAMYSVLSENRKDVEEKIQKKAALFESAAKGVLHENVLEDIIISLHGTNLGDIQAVENSRRKKAPSLMLEWLGISLLSHMSRQIGEEDTNQRGSETADCGDKDLAQVDQEEKSHDSRESPDTENEEQNLYESETEETEQEGRADENLNNPEIGKWKSYADDVAEAAELLKLADTEEEEDASDIASVTTEGDDAADLLAVTEEADLVQAERMIEDDDVQKQIQQAKRRIDQTKRVVLAYVPEEEKVEVQSKTELYDEGWEITKDMKKKLNRIVKVELLKTDHMPEEEAEQITNLWALSYTQRWHLYRLWLLKYRNDIRRQILEYENEYQRTVNRITELRNQEDQTVLKMAYVIGMTTTCAARYRKVLQDIQPKIVVVEEAAEVLEAHIVTTLTSGCEHLILIGDHQQLRPSATVYELAKNFNLEVSLFERLIRMNLPYVRLDYQHRMRPEIARLLTPHIYDKLENHDSVCLYDNIKGVTTNVFFVEHKHLEESIHEGRSHQNLHEANFVKSLCHYFICQGYEPSQITVLTTYTGQLHCLKKVMPKSKFEGVKLCVVDRYQGEENDIIILSLVRSNQEGKVGFLQIPNRVCVALSRAKKGLFCIGNMGMLSTVPLWSKIMNVLRSNGQIGEALMVRCENHPETANFVSAAEDFLKVPHGGCLERCEYRLNCGHVCTRFCHPYDLDHKDFICRKPCSKTLCDDGHTCPKQCSAKCGKCKVIVTKTLPKCGHEQKMPCSEPLETFSCHMQCNKPLSCGHLCVRECGDTCTRKCPQNVTVNLDCGHQRSILCYEKQEAEKKNEKILCFVKCEGRLQCGHECFGSCSECSNGMSHVACRSKCKEVLICSHQCQNKCSEECAPCFLPCDHKCFHRKCDQKCCMPCQPCTQPCGWGCKHHQCTKLCFELCDRKPCERPCFRKLKCKHQCIGMCGEPCPKKCRICHADEVQEQFFGKEADPEARFVQLQDCNHSFEVTGFDTWMMPPENNGPIKLNVCPKCNTPIRRSVRYGSVIKRTLIEMEQVKKKTVEMCSTQLLISVTEREEMKKYFPLVLEKLLSKLDKADLTMPKLLLIKDQITILSKLAEIKKNVQLLLPVTFLRDKIDKEVDICSSNITTPIYINFLLEKEVIRISLLAEAYVMSYMHNKPILSSAVMLAHIRCSRSLDKPKELEHIICRLERSVMALKDDEEIKNIRKTLNSLQERLKLHMLFKILEEENHKLLDGAIFRQGQWYKCSQGHVYWNQASGSEQKVGQCPDC
ncbi:NFX1-type zinc finger-containing protein 1-like isoform X2 [Polyodon spathula]|uniref:NFX1-type zinc finger-containing protein 1-like isoform X2 n=1 Tax=Polyodon spathula TaxID=7913 RepID=UPI001B7F6010|nr:NFX1-type zinc finger-containing protein 1-like isoform X2 [Polyodon spathula]